MSVIDPSAHVTSSQAPATGAVVARSYAVRVLLPLFAAPAVGQAVVWVVENPVGSRGHATAFFIVAVLIGWCVSCAGTVMLSRRFRDDRLARSHNRARGWHQIAVFLLVAAWAPVVVVLLVALGLAIGFSAMRT